VLRFFNYDIAKKFKVSFGGVLRSGKPYTKPLGVMKPSKWK
jgi:hypothetical protein